MDIKYLADNLIRKYESRNPFDIAGQMNVILIHYPLDGIRGFYQHFQRNDLIYIDESLNQNDSLFVCAHELGHMLLHKKSNAIFLDSRTHLCIDKYEIEADRFAINLLISDSTIEENLDCNYEQLSHLFGYNQKLIELRLKDFQ